MNGPSVETFDAVGLLSRLRADNPVKRPAPISLQQQGGNNSNQQQSDSTHALKQRIRDLEESRFILEKEIDALTAENRALKTRNKEIWDEKVKAESTAAENNRKYEQTVTQLRKKLAMISLDIKPGVRSRGNYQEPNKKKTDHTNSQEISPVREYVQDSAQTPYLSNSPAPPQVAVGSFAGPTFSELMRR